MGVELSVPDLYPVGNAADLSWWIPLGPIRVSEVLDDQIRFTFPLIAKGHSGGGLFNSKSDLVGMITADEPRPYGRALEIHRVLRTLESWRYPIDLNVHDSGGHIHDAIRSQRIADLQSAVSSACPELERTNEAGATPLAAASGVGWAQGVGVLLQSRADVNGKSGSVVPLMAAISNRHPTVGETLLANHADPNLGSPLEAAITSRQPEIARILLSFGADTKNGRPVASAIEVGDAMTLRLLLDKYGATLSGGASVLAGPISRNDRDVLDVLMDHGVSANDYVGDDTPLMIAARSSTPEIVETILRHGAKLDARERVIDSHAYTALQISILRGDLQITRLLVNSGSGLQSSPWFPPPPLELAYIHLKDGGSEREEIFDFLLRSDRTSPQDRGLLLMRLLGDGNYEVVSKVLTMETDVNVADRHGGTSLQILAHEGKLRTEEKCRIFRMLLDHGARTTVSNSSVKQLADGLEAACRPH